MIYTWIQLKWTMLGLGLFMVLTHLFALLKPKSAQATLRKFPRNYEAGVLMTIVAAAWFFLLVKYMDLGEFGNWRKTVLVVVPVATVLSILFMRDFLAVRALGMLVLMLAEPLLESSDMRDETIRLLMPVLVYVWILFAMFWVGMPYTLRDQIAWVTANEKRWKTAALFGLIYGILLCVGGVTVPILERDVPETALAQSGL